MTGHKLVMLDEAGTITPAQYEAALSMARAKAAAIAVYEDLANDPRVWLTHGLPNEGKEELIIAAIARAIAKETERASAKSVPQLLREAGMPVTD